MSRISEQNLERYTRNLKTYMAHALNEVTVATFYIENAKTITIDNLDGNNVTIDWNGDGSDVETINTTYGKHTYKKGTYTCKIYNLTTIGDSSFMGTPLTNILIGSTVKNLGQKAFQQTLLTSIVIPKNITYMGNNIFNGLETLETAVFNASVTSIPTGTFRNCKNLTSFNIPDYITTIVNNVFTSCTNLTSIVIPKSVTFIGNGVFNSCTNLTSIVIPKSVTSIGSKAFNDSSNLTIHCEATSEPSTWTSDWHGDILESKIKWGYFEYKEQAQKLIDDVINGALGGSY